MYFASLENGIIIPQKILNWIKRVSAHTYRLSLIFHFQSKKRGMFDRSSPYGVRFPLVRGKSVQDSLYRY